MLPRSAGTLGTASRSEPETKRAASSTCPRNSRPPRSRARPRAGAASLRTPAPSGPRRRRAQREARQALEQLGDDLDQLVLAYRVEPPDERDHPFAADTERFCDESRPRSDLRRSEASRSDDAHLASRRRPNTRVAAALTPITRRQRSATSRASERSKLRSCSTQTTGTRVPRVASTETSAALIPLAWTSAGVLRRSRGGAARRATMPGRRGDVGSTVSEDPAPGSGPQKARPRSTTSRIQSRGRPSRTRPRYRSAPAGRPNGETKAIGITCRPNGSTNSSQKAFRASSRTGLL